MLVTTSLTITALIYFLLYVSYHDVLLSLTLSTLALYFLGYLSYRFHRLFLSSMYQLQMTTGERSINKKSQGVELVSSLNQSSESIQSNESVKELDILYGVFKQWPFPVAIFNFDNKLVFFNQAMFESLNSPLCRGMTIDECGFTYLATKCHHPKLDNEWKIDSFSLANNRLRLITASYIRHQLQTVKRESQQDLIRILSHEINNSITPIASLADSILSASNMPQVQVNAMLERIRTRSERLLEFIQAYIQLSKLPEPKLEYFNLKELVLQNAEEQGIELVYQGDAQCFADAMLFEQLIINVLKNAKEANQSQCVITVSKTNNGKEQKINIQDNGPGFYNLDNALTPLYTTKKQGHGLGLSLCDDIVQLHQGRLKINNTKAGALLLITLPSN
jgi:signal transduction histidine kinase